jgi:peptide/nickel transport system substrate-binding protein
VLTPVQAQEIAEFQLHTYPFDITTWSQGRAEPDVLRTVFSSFYEGQSVRFDNADEELDELLVALQSATGDDRAAAAESAQRDILEKGYALPIYDPKRFIGVSNELQGFNVDIEAKPIFYDLSK